MDLRRLGARLFKYTAVVKPFADYPATAANPPRVVQFVTEYPARSNFNPDANLIQTGVLALLSVSLPLLSFFSSFGNSRSVINVRANEKRR